MNTTSFCHLDVETCPTDIPVDFCVREIIPINLKKATKLCKFLALVVLWSIGIDNLMVIQLDYAVMHFLVLC